MMNHSLKNQFNIRPGTVIEGKWHHQQYTIMKELGFGANGIVYLAQNNKQQVALKMSDNGMSITSEVNVLKSFAKVQGSALGPSLLDVDDWIQRGSQISFYAMEYIQGPDLLTFIKKNGHAWTEVLILQLLSDLHRLHQNGWVFGDLKPDNLIVTGPPSRIRCIDVGGTTIQGRAIKEFTEFFDRGYWGLGTRKADPNYDLFAVAMILINMSYPQRFSKTTGDLKQLRLAIREKAELMQYEDILLHALTGKFADANEMRSSILQRGLTSAKSPSSLSQKGQSQIRAKKTAVTRQTKPKRRKSSGVLETLFIFTIITLLYVFYLYGQLT
ncbi:protein kinase domain-containing protein [Cytobacillus eiseniae]|nr:protein kinase family protein [Cytobacillus eiseniae]